MILFLLNVMKNRSHCIGNSFSALIILRFAEIYCKIVVICMILRYTFHIFLCYYKFTNLCFLRLARFLETAGSVLNYFEKFLGRIEILGGSKRIERVYFEIKESNIEQWEKPQIKVSIFQ